MANGIDGIDHVIVAVRNLDAAEAAYRRLGFTITPRGFHSVLNSANHTIMFERDYVELLALLRPHAQTQWFAEFLRDGEGLAGIIPKTHDAHAALQCWRLKGSSRSSHLISAAQLNSPQACEKRDFASRHWRPSTPPGCACYFSASVPTRSQSGSSSMGLPKMRAYDVPLLVMGTGAAMAGFDGLRVPTDARIAALAIRVRDLGRTRRVLEEKGVPVDDFGDRLRVAAPYAGGTILEFL